VGFLEAAVVLIRLWIEGSQPLAGTAATEGSEPLRFHGWLELLTVVSELLAVAPSSGEDADTDERVHSIQAIALTPAGDTMSESRDPQYPDSAAALGREIQRLGALVGRWRSEGHIVGEVPIPIIGTDIYEWLPGGFFLVHHVDVMIGKQPVQAIELIGEYDQATDSFTGRAYDNQGNITIMRAKVDGAGVWTFTGDSDVAPVAGSSSADASGAVRSTLTVGPDKGSMTAIWERSDDGVMWQRWMDMTFSRIP
jgi:Protein of unknown function (DUF1579)